MCYLDYALGDLILNNLIKFKSSSLELNKMVE